MSVSSVGGGGYPQEYPVGHSNAYYLNVLQEIENYIIVNGQSPEAIKKIEALIKELKGEPQTPQIKNAIKLLGIVVQNIYQGQPSSETIADLKIIAQDFEQQKKALK